MHTYDIVVLCNVLFYLWLSRHRQTCFISFDELNLLVLYVHMCDSHDLCQNNKNTNAPICIQEQQTDRACHCDSPTYHWSIGEATPGFSDFSSAFNTIIPNRLITKLHNLGLPQSICLWIKDFLTDHSQRVNVGPHLSSALSLNIGSPQGCVLSPQLYTLYTHGCTPTHPQHHH